MAQRHGKIVWASENSEPPWHFTRHTRLHVADRIADIHVPKSQIESAAGRLTAPFRKVAVMEPDSSYSAAAQFTQYDKLVAEYRSVAAQCQACHDQLAAAERELRTCASRMNDHEPDVDREIDAAQAHILDGHANRWPWDVAHLSRRERQVFVLIGEGLTTHEMAEKLSLATSTVETYRERLKTKLKVSSGHALVRQAVLWVVRTPDEAAWRAAMATPIRVLRLLASLDKAEAIVNQILRLDAGDKADDLLESLTKLIVEMRKTAKEVMRDDTL